VNSYRAMTGKQGFHLCMHPVRRIDKQKSERAMCVPVCACVRVCKRERECAWCMHVHVHVHVCAYNLKHLSRHGNFELVLNLCSLWGVFSLLRL
jgi:hypothetical protein